MRYATAEVCRVDLAHFGERIAPDAIATEASSVDLAELYERCRGSKLVHDAFMQARGRLYITDSAIYIRCELGEEARASAEDVMFHPVLLDASAVCGGCGADLAAPRTARESALALPLYYESFRAVDLVQRECLTRILRSSIRHAGELSFCTLEFFSSSGRKLAELTDVAAKAVRDRVSIDSASRSGASNPSCRDAGGVELAVNVGSAVHSTAGPSTDSPLDAEWLLRRILGKRLGRRAEQVDPAKGYYELGLKSADLLELVHVIETELRVRLSPTLLFEHGTVEQLCAHLEESGVLRGSARRLAGTRAARPETQRTVGTYVFTEDEPFLRDHRVFDEPALMGVTHPCLVLESYLGGHNDGFPVELRNVRFRGGPITLKPGESATVTVLASSTDCEGTYRTEYDTSRSRARRICCDIERVGATHDVAEKVDLDALLAGARRMSGADVEQLYSRTADFTIGPLLRTAEDVWIVDDSTQVIRVNLAGGTARRAPLVCALDPLVLSSCYTFHLPEVGRRPAERRISVPLAIERVVVRGRVPPEFYVVLK
ncbi:MAG: phosphopantetheine-binding protein, partial [Steroidobacteraceae bacterium]